MSLRLAACHVAVFWNTNLRNPNIFLSHSHPKRLIESAAGNLRSYRGVLKATEKPVVPDDRRNWQCLPFYFVGKCWR
jgi:hypothetical protein